MNWGKSLSEYSKHKVHLRNHIKPLLVLLLGMYLVFVPNTPVWAQSKQVDTTKIQKSNEGQKKWFQFYEKPLAAIQQKIDGFGYKKTISDKPTTKEIVVKKTTTKEKKPLLKNPFPALQKKIASLSQKKQTPEKTIAKDVVVNTKPIKEKKPSIAKSNEKIKIHLPTISKASLQQITSWTNKIGSKLFGTKEASNATVRKIKKSQIERLTDKKEDVQLALEQLENKKQQLLQYKERLENRIAVLNNPDSVRTVLAQEIKASELNPSASMSIPVGFTDLDEQIRNLQLLEKIPSNYSLTVRPYVTDTKLTYEKILQAIDSNINYQGTIYRGNKTIVTLLPVTFTQKINTDHPFGWNDGAMSFSKGYQYQIGAGVFASWHKIKLQLRPEYVNTSNSPYETSSDWGQVTTAYKKMTLGQSSLRVDLGKLTIAASTQNLYWGPGIFNSMVMSNNAQGFFHYSINTNRPIKNFLGTFEFQLIAGKLTMDSSQGFENFNMKKRAYLISNDRYINGLNLAYQPAFMKNVSFGLNRVFYNNMSKDFTGAVPTYLPVIGSFFGSAYNDTINRDQLLSFNTRWLMPKNHAEIYFEFGWNDAKDNFRDLMVDFSHSSGYTFGFKKLAYLNNENKGAYLDFGAELTRMAATPSQIMRAAGNWYEHGGNAAYTNQNQILGTGSGMGNNTQVVYLGWNKGWDKLGIIFKRINQNPEAQVASIATVGVRTTLWDDYAYGLQTKYRYKNLLFSANMEWVDSRNYLWKQGHNVGNFYAFINTMYLW